MSPERIDLINDFLNGVIFLGHATAGLFFFRFWARTRDRLFVLFAIAFWMFALIRLAIVVLDHADEDQLLFWFRLAAYLLILAAIIDKNWRK
jgi:4-hydroxybenzoate polyprenyltransferase